jgi:hypothetical protein
MAGAQFAHLCYRLAVALARLARPALRGVPIPDPDLAHTLVALAERLESAVARLRGPADGSAAHGISGSTSESEDRPRAAGAAHGSVSEGTDRPIAGGRRAPQRAALARKVHRLREKQGAAASVTPARRTPRVRP